MLIQKGCHALYPNGTNGECMKLTVAERKKIAEIMVEVSKGRALVYSQVGAPLLSDTLELALHAKECGCDGIGVVTPQYHSVNDREMEEYYVEIANAVGEDFPVYMYNIPNLSGNDIKPEVAARIAGRCKNVIGMKYSGADVRRTMAYLSIAEDGKFPVMHGTDRFSTAWYAMGCDGIISGAANAIPEPYVAGYEAWVRGDMEEAKRMFQACHASNSMLNGLKGIKQAITYRGLNGGHCRKPALDLTEPEIAGLHAKLDAYFEKWGFEKEFGLE